MATIKNPAVWYLLIVAFCLVAFAFAIGLDIGAGRALSHSNNQDIRASTREVIALPSFPCPGACAGRSAYGFLDALRGCPHWGLDIEAPSG